MFKFDKDHLPLDVPFPDAKRRNVASSDRWDLLPKRGPKFQMVKQGTKWAACVRRNNEILIVVVFACLKVAQTTSGSFGVTPCGHGPQIAPNLRRNWFKLDLRRRLRLMLVAAR